MDSGRSFLTKQRETLSFDLVIINYGKTPHNQDKKSAKSKEN
jgi:hypothetical protein